jgi:hypothetical protein
MENQSILTKLKREFHEEINDLNVSLEELKKTKVSNEILQTEVALRKIFGDEIYEKQGVVENVEGVKEVIKLNEEDIAFDSEIQKLCEDLVDNNFETGVNVILSKMSGEDEDEE